jgi:hypothetical protein
MTTDYKALCAELVATWKKGDDIVGAMNRARAALAEGAGVGPSDKELLELMPQQMRDNLAAASRELGQLAGTAAGIHRVIFNTDALDYARAVLARYGTHPRPIPVAERLPTEADLDAEGRCWWYSPARRKCKADWWEFATSVAVGDTHWLPAAAIPLPEATP